MKKYSKLFLCLIFGFSFSRCNDDGSAKKISAGQKKIFKKNFTERKIDSQIIDSTGGVNIMNDTVYFSFSSGWNDSVVLTTGDTILFSATISTIPSLSVTHRGVLFVRKKESNIALKLYIINKKEYINFDIGFSEKYIKLSYYDGYILFKTNSLTLVY